MVQAALSGSDLAATAKWLRDEHPDIAKAMGKTLREAAKPILEAERQAVQSLTFSTEIVTRSRILRRKQSRVVAGTGTARGSGRTARATAKATTSYQTAIQTGKRRVSAGQMAKLQARAGLRASIARGMRVTYSDRGKEAKATVKTTAASMPPDQRRMPRLVNYGRWRHPVFGNRKTWVTQRSSRVGWWVQTAEKELPAVMVDMSKSLDAIAEQIAREGLDVAGSPTTLT